MSSLSGIYPFNIRGLMLVRNSDLTRITKCIDEYIESVPQLTEQIRIHVYEDLMGLFIDRMNTAVSMLDNVCARWLQKDGEKILRLAENGQHAICIKETTPFVANLLALSIEMQTAKNNCHQHGNTKQRTVENLIDIGKNLNVVYQIMLESQNLYAADILSGMSMLDNDETAMKLIRELRLGKIPMDLIEALIIQYSAKVEQVWEGQTNTDHKILLVDDRPEILDTVGGFLKDKYRVFALTSGKLALKFLKNHTPSLFILDIDMPDMDGITLTQKIRSIPGYETVPVIMLTSNASKEYVLRSIQAGANDFIVKPADHKTILAKIYNFLS